MKRSVVSFVILSLALVPANARRFAEGPVTLTVYPAKASESADKVRLLPKAEDLTDGDAVPLYEKAVQAMPRGIKQDQIREWLKLPPDQLPQQQAEEMVQKYLESLKLVVRATKCKQCNWPEWKPGTEPPDLSNYRELAFVIQLWARLEISRGGHEGALRAMQAGFAMARQLGQAPIILQVQVATAVGEMMCREVEYFAQAKDAPNLHPALAELPRPFVDVEKAIEKESANLKDYNVLVRRQFEELLKPAHDMMRMIQRRANTRLNALQCLEAMRHYAAMHDGQLPEALSDVSDIEVPQDLMSGKAFEYHRTTTGATLQSVIPEGGNERDAVRYEIVIQK